MIDQNFLREQIKRLKWQEDISFKEVAEELLNINYHSFINWKQGKYDLCEDKAKQLYDYICCLIE